MIEILINIILIGVFIIGLLLTAVGLFGNYLIYLSIVLYVFITKFDVLSVGHLIFLGVLFLSGELLEYFLSVYGVRFTGGDNKTVLMTIFGAFFGAIVLGLMTVGIGIIAGAFIGALLSAFLTTYYRQRSFGKSIKSAIGVILGWASAVVCKLIIAVIIIVYTVFQIYK